MLYRVSSRHTRDTVCGLYMFTIMDLMYYTHSTYVHDRTYIQSDPSSSHNPLLRAAGKIQYDQAEGE